LSETDSMTSLMNYHGIFNNIEKLIRHKTPFSLTIIDIDNFGIFNKNSFKLGDDVLKEFSVLLRNALPENALLARFRIGDEFLVVFKNRNLQEAKDEINKFKEACMKYPFSSLQNFPGHSLSFSEGFSEFTPKISSVEDLFSEAEELLRITKSQKLKKQKV